MGIYKEILQMKFRHLQRATYPCDENLVIYVGRKELAEIRMIIRRLATTGYLDSNNFEFLGMKVVEVMLESHLNISNLN